MIVFTPAQLQGHLKNNRCEEQYVVTPAGSLKVRSTTAGIITGEFSESAVTASCEIIPTPLIVSGTEFQIKVWQETLKIPAGTVITYSELAKRIGKPRAIRAVANALGANKIAYFIPCHRVIRKSGELGGYRWGIAVKKKLLEAEKSAM